MFLFACCVVVVVVWLHDGADFLKEVSRICVWGVVLVILVGRLWKIGCIVVVAILVAFLVVFILKDLQIEV